MTYPSRTLDGFDALWHHPVRWFVRQFTFYLIFVAIAVPIVLAGAAIYSFLLRQPETPVSLPDKKPASPSEEKPPIQFPSWAETIPMAEVREKAIGAPLFIGKQQVGTVSDLVKDSQGQIIGIVIQRTRRIPGNRPETVQEMRSIGSNDVQWHATVGQNKTGEIRDVSVLDDANLGMPY